MRAFVGLTRRARRLARALDAAELSARRIARSSPQAVRTALGVRRDGCGADRLIAAGLDAFHDGAVGRAEPQRGRAGLRQNLAAVLFDDFGECLAVGDLEPPVVDARAGAGEHRALAVVAVP